ncbi:hypothetical protein H8356DRAFT_1352663 [Neocallimastix lanati (nom. inval.)]|nr:hypothetical protein H8356DRAFT_1352663 [Neocallimastix sp. JGI-2020a]
MLFSVIVIKQVSYYALLLGSNKERTKSIKRLDFQMGIALHPFISVSKELNIPPLSMKCTIAQKNSKYTISDLLRDISRYRRHAWDKESKILVYPSTNIPSLDQLARWTECYKDLISNITGHSLYKIPVLLMKNNKAPGPLIVFPLNFTKQCFVNITSIVSVPKYE